MLNQESMLTQQQSDPQNRKQEQQTKETQEGFYFQQFPESYQMEVKSRDSLILKLISISLLMIIAMLIMMMGNSLSQNDKLIRKIITEHDQNTMLQDEFEDNVMDIRDTIRSIKITQINDKQQRNNEVNQLKGIVQKYENKMSEIEKFLAYPQISIEGELDIQAQNLIYIRKAKISLDQLEYLDKQKQYSIKHQTKDYQMIIPKHIWVFKEKPFNYIRKLTNENRLYYSKISGYQIHFVNYDNMRTYLPKKISNNIKKGIKILQKRLSGQSLHFASKKLILLGFLQVHGGIMLDGLYTITQDLSWVQDIINNPIVSRGNRFVQPQIITFYNPLQSKLKEKFNILPFEGMKESDKYVVQFPKIQEYFIAAKKGTQFIEQLIAKINELINNIDQFWSYNQIYNIKLDKIQDFIKNIIFVASRIILIQKQKILDLKHNNDHKHFAFDYYGVNCINGNYGPLKSSVVFQQNIQSQVNLQNYYHIIYHDLARYSYQELSSYIGQFKYLSNFNFQYFLNNFIEKSSNGKDIQIYDGSFIQKIYYPQKKHSFIIQNPQKSFINQTNQMWNSLNRIVWVWQKKEEKPEWMKIYTNNIKHKAMSSNFEVKFLNQDNIQLYLSEQILLKIISTIRKSTLNNIVNMRSYFYRLAILYQYGGIFIEQSTFVFQNFDVLMSIGKYPSQFIFNRFDTLPKVLMFFNPYARSQEKWDIHSISKDKSSKAQWHQQFVHDILISEEGNQFIGEWLDTLFEITILKSYQIQDLFRRNRINQHRASDWARTNIFFIDAAKYVFGRKQVLLEKEQNKNFVNSAHYYKLWTINTYLTPFKLNKFNYQSNQPINQYVYQFPRETVESIIGEIHFQSSFTYSSDSSLNILLKQSIEANFNGKMHDHSFIKEMMHSYSDSANKSTKIANQLNDLK